MATIVLERSVLARIHRFAESGAFPNVEAVIVTVLDALERHDARLLTSAAPNVTEGSPEAAG